MEWGADVWAQIWALAILARETYYDGLMVLQII